MSKAAQQNQKQLYQELALQGATESVREIYGIIYENGLTSAKILIQKSTYSARTVRYALKVLLDLKLIDKIPDLEDFRKSNYLIIKPV